MTYSYDYNVTGDFASGDYSHNNTCIDSFDAKFKSILCNGSKTEGPKLSNATMDGSGSNYISYSGGALTKHLYA